MIPILPKTYFLNAITEQGALIPPPKKKIPGIGLPGMGAGMPGGLLAEMAAKRNMQVRGAHIFPDRIDQ